jgi:hypothetical protein
MTILQQEIEKIDPIRVPPRNPRLRGHAGVVFPPPPFTNGAPATDEKLLRGIPSYENSLYGSNNYIA